MTRVSLIWAWGFHEGIKGIDGNVNDSKCNNNDKVNNNNNNEDDKDKGGNNYLDTNNDKGISALTLDRDLRLSRRHQWHQRRWR